MALLFGAQMLGMIGYLDNRKIIEDLHVGSRHLWFLVAFPLPMGHIMKPPGRLNDLDFFDRNVQEERFRDIAGDTGPDDDFWEPQPVNSDLADIDSWFEEPNDLPGRDWSLKDFLRKPEEPLGDLGFFDRNVQENPTSNLTGSSGLDDFSGEDYGTNPIERLSCPGPTICSILVPY